MTVRQLAERTGVSPHTLRYYEREGLIPGVARRSNGHRSYNREHVFWVGFVRRLRATGMSIGEIREYAELVRAGDTSLRERQTLLARHRERLEARISELEDNLELLALKQRFYRGCEESGDRDDFLVFLERHGRALDGSRRDGGGSG